MMKVFSPFKPMELKAVQGLPQDTSKYLYQIKWDGIRGVVHVSPDEVKVFNRNLYDKTLQYPELQQLVQWKKTLILDGEIVVLKDGLPSFSRVIKRDFASNIIKIASLTKALPIVYCVFDILYYNGVELISLPLAERLEFMKRLKKEQEMDCIYFSDASYAGSELLTLTKEKNMEGIVAKEVSGTYEIGYKSGKWQKIKHRRLQKCVVCGFTTKDLRPSALVLGAFNENNQLIYIGRAGSGLTGQDLALLKEGTKPLISDKPSLLNAPKDKGNYTWLEPRLTVLVEFSEWTEDLSLRAPVVKGFTNALPEECRL